MIFSQPSGWRFPPRAERSGCHSSPALKQLEQTVAGQLAFSPCAAKTVYCQKGDRGLRHPGMKYVCDAPGRKSWFRIETEAEAERESMLMDHAVAKYFRRERETVIQSYKPTSMTRFEQNIGLQAHIQREMPLFLTLRDAEGGGLVTAMLPPNGGNDPQFRIIIVGKGNGDPYAEHEAAIHALGLHFGLILDRARCYPYRL